MGKGKKEILAVPRAFVGFVEVERSRRGSAAGGFALRTPDSIPHVSIGGVTQSHLSEQAQVGFVFLHLLVAAGKIQGDFFHVVHTEITDIPNLQPCAFDVVNQPLIIFEVRGLGVGPDVDVFASQLADELQVLRSRVGADLDGKLDPRRVRVHLGSAGNWICKHRCPSQTARERKFCKPSPPRVKPGFFLGLSREVFQQVSWNFPPFSELVKRMFA